MTQMNKGWTVHDEEQAVLSYDYRFARGASSRSFVARLNDGQLVVFSPPCGLGDEAYGQLASYGEVGAIVAPNGFHHLGLAEWKAHFPNATCYADPRAIARIGKKNPAAPPLTDIRELKPLVGDHLALTVLEDTKCGELWARAATKQGDVLYASDVLSNFDQFPPKFLIRLFFKMTGTKTGIGPFSTALKFIVGNRKKALQQLSDELREHAPAVLVPAHGAIASGDGLADEIRASIAESL